MKCAHTKLAVCYADGELAGKAREGFENHLRGCRACRLELETLRRADELFALAPRHQAPPGFSTRVMARLEEKQGSTFAWFPLCVRFGGGVAMLAVLTVGGLYGRSLADGFLARNSATTASALYLDMFAPAPPGSIGGAYLALAEGRHEK